MSLKLEVFLFYSNPNNKKWHNCLSCIHSVKLKPLWYSMEFTLVQGLTVPWPFAPAKHTHAGLRPFRMVTLVARKNNT